MTTESTGDGRAAAFQPLYHVGSLCVNTVLEMSYYCINNYTTNIICTITMSEGHLHLPAYINVTKCHGATLGAVNSEAEGPS